MRDKGGEGVQKPLNFAWRHLWMVPSLEKEILKCVCPKSPKIGTSRINVIRRVCYSVTQNYFPLAITQRHLYASVYRSAHIAVRPSGQFLKTAAEQANNWELVRWQASFTNERADDANTEALYFLRNSGEQGHKSFVIDCKILPSVPPPSNAIQSRSASFFLIRTFQTKLRDKRRFDIRDDVNIFRTILKQCIISLLHQIKERKALSSCEPYCGMK